MKSPIEWLARRLWYAMLWFMRRPRVKRLRLNFPSYLPEKSRAGAWNSFRRQERWARQYGLTVMRVVVALFGSIILFQLLGALVLTLQSNGGLSVPEKEEFPSR